MSQKHQIDITKDAQIVGDRLIISLPLLEEPRESKSGKSLTLATTSGNMRTSAEWEGKPVVVGANAYVKK